MLIYLGTVIMSLGTSFLIKKCINKELKNRGYKEKKQNIYYDILKFLQIFLLCLIPVFNFCFFTAVIIKSKDLIEYCVTQKMLSDSLVKIEPKELIEDEKLDNEELVTNKSNVISYDVKNELSREEKIKFLKEELHRLTGRNIVISISKEKQKIKTKVR